MPQVGAGAVAIVPTFRGFRRSVDAETDKAAKSADRGFRRAFSKTGSESGKQTGTGFRKAYESSTKGFADRSVRELEQAVAKSARALSAARLREQDAAGRVRVAESVLAEARKKYAADSSQVVRAEETLAAALRKVETAQENTADSTQDLRAAQKRLADNAEQQGSRFASAWRRSNDRVSDVFKGSFLGTTAANIVTGAASRIGANIGEGIRDGISFALGTIDIASDLNESLNAVEVSYGNAADGIFKIGQTSARTFGLGAREVNSYAVQFSAFSKNIAGEGGNVVGTFESILGRATDFASVMNLEVAEALTLFQSGLAGETEPLRRYGIDLSAAAVEAYALANGLVESSIDTRKVEIAQGRLARATKAYGDDVAKYGEQSDQAAVAREKVTLAEIAVEKAMSGAKVTMTEQQKQQARYAYLLEQTNLTAGDFANTSDELANKQRIQAALWDDLQARMGASFLPVAQEVTTVLTDELMPALEDVFDENGPELADAFSDAIPGLRELADELLPKLPMLIESAADGLPVLLEMITTFGPPLIDLISDLTTGAQQIQDFVGDAGEDLEVGAEQWGSFFETVGGWFDTFFGKLDEGRQQIEGFFGAVGGALEPVGNFLGLSNSAATVSAIPFGRDARTRDSAPSSTRRGRDGGDTFQFNIDGRGSDSVEIGNVAANKVANIMRARPN